MHLNDSKVTFKKGKVQKEDGGRRGGGGRGGRGRGGGSCGGGEGGKKTFWKLEERCMSGNWFSRS